LIWFFHKTTYPSMRYIILFIHILVWQHYYLIIITLFIGGFNNFPTQSGIFFVLSLPQSSPAPTVFSGFNRNATNNGRHSHACHFIGSTWHWYRYKETHMINQSIALRDSRRQP
jgi:hypothetical protein